MSEQTKAYKCYNKVTGKYWIGGGYLSALWGPKGKLYKRIADIKASLRMAGRWGKHPFIPEECEIIVYDLTEVERIPCQVDKSGLA